MKIYELRINVNDFYPISKDIVVSNLRVNDGFVIFRCSSEVKKYLDKKDIDYKVIKDNSPLSLLKIYKGIICGTIIFLFLVYFNSKRITNIEFNNNYVINDEIESMIYSNTKNVLGFKMIDNITNIEQEIRNKFISYPWISLRKKGTTICVTISDYDSDIVNTENNIIGNIVSSYDSVINYIYTYQGKSIRKANDYVKKGDILIDSLNNYQAKGIIIGNVFETYSVNIKKEEYITEYTNNNEKIYSVSLLNKSFDLKKNYKLKEYEESNKLIFNFFNFFKIYKKQRSEIVKLKNEYSLQEARNRAIELYEKEFKENMVSDLEEIKSIEILEVITNDESYDIKLLALVNKSIGEFIPLE